MPLATTLPPSVVPLSGFLLAPLLLLAPLFFLLPPLCLPAVYAALSPDLILAPAVFQPPVVVHLPLQLPSFRRSSFHACFQLFSLPSTVVLIPIRPRPPVFGLLFSPQPCLLYVARF